MDVMRKAYRDLTEPERARLEQFKDLGERFVRLCDDTEQSREMSLAKTNMEQAVMWAVKGVTG